jgi:TolB-like protein
MRAVNVVKAAVWIALFAGISTAGMKYVAVVETDIDVQSGASKQLNSADVRQVTATLRREAVRNLPQSQYSIMTSETVQAQGGAVLEECADENCVITLGSKIGADYIVRGTVSKLGAKFTLSAEIYETENGNLVGSSDLISAGNIEELVKGASSVCADMYRTFINLQNSKTQTKQKPPVNVKQKKAAPAKVQPQTYSQQQPYQNFTSEERWRTFGLNFIPGLGSFAIMKDREAGLIQVGAVISGTACLLIASVDWEDGGQPKELADMLSSTYTIMGYAAFAGCLIVNVARSLTYKKPLPKTAFNEAPDGFSIAVMPDRNGDLKGYVFYNKSF